MFCENDEVIIIIQHCQWVYTHVRLVYTKWSM